VNGNGAERQSRASPDLREARVRLAAAVGMLEHLVDGDPDPAELAGAAIELVGQADARLAPIERRAAIRLVS
jgi:hypothetical protein